MSEPATVLDRLEAASSLGYNPVFPSGYMRVAPDDFRDLLAVARAAELLPEPGGDEPGPYVYVRVDELRALHAARRPLLQPAEPPR